MGRNLVLITVATLLVVLAPLAVHAPTAALAQSSEAPGTAAQVTVGDGVPEDALAACIVAFRAAAIADRPDLASTARHCESLEDWVLASAVYPQALDQSGAMDVVATLCADASNGLMADAICGNVASWRLTPPSPSAAPAVTADPADTEAVAQAFVDLVARWNAGFAPIDTLWDEEDTARQGEYWTTLANHDERFLCDLLTLAFPAAVAPQVEAYAHATSEMALLEWRLAADPADVTLRQQVGAVSQADLDAGAALWDALGLARDP